MVPIYVCAAPLTAPSTKVLKKLSLCSQNSILKKYRKSSVRFCGLVAIRSRRPPGTAHHSPGTQHRTHARKHTKHTHPPIYTPLVPPLAAHTTRPLAQFRRRPLARPTSNTSPEQHIQSQAAPTNKVPPVVFFKIESRPPGQPPSSR